MAVDVSNHSSGRMRPDEWLETSTAMYKLDYEHHNFGAAELDIVDPAYDLATAVFEFGLTEQAESELVHAYARQTADGSDRKSTRLNSSHGYISYAVFCLKKKKKKTKMICSMQI